MNITFLLDIKKVYLKFSLKQKPFSCNIITCTLEGKTYFAPVPSVQNKFVSFLFHIPTVKT